MTGPDTISVCRQLSFGYFKMHFFFIQSNMKIIHVDIDILIFKFVQESNTYPDDHNTNVLLVIR